MEAGGQNGVDDAWRKAATSGNGAWIELRNFPRERISSGGRDHRVDHRKGSWKTHVWTR